MYVCVCMHFPFGFFYSTCNKICGKWKPSAGKGISLPLRSNFTLPTSKDDAEKPWEAQGSEEQSNVQHTHATPNCCLSQSLNLQVKVSPPRLSQSAIILCAALTMAMKCRQNPSPYPILSRILCLSSTQASRPSSVTFSCKRIYCNARAAGGFRLGADFKAIATSSSTCTCLCCHYS